MRSLGNLTGQQFYHWTVLHEAERSPTGKKKWVCRCVCGRERHVFQGVLQNGKSRSCGCRNGADLTGRRFGHLEALTPVIRGDGVRVWLCKCDCGDDGVLVRANSLVEGHTTSCGCFGLEKRREFLKTFRKEPGTSTRSVLYGKYKYHAKKRGYEFTLERQDFDKLVNEDCYYCGSPPTNLYKCFAKGVSPEWRVKNEIAYNGLDRVDNSVGYQLTNVVTCCVICNIAKRSMTLEQFSDWIARLTWHENKTGNIAKMVAKQKKKGHPKAPPDPPQEGS